MNFQTAVNPYAVLSIAMLNLFLENMLLFYSSEIGIERKSNENLGISLSFPPHNLENVLLA